MEWGRAPHTILLITRAVKLQAGKSCLERAVQHFYPLELRCKQEMTKETNENQLDVNGNESRPRQNVAAIAVVKVNDQINNEHEVPNIQLTFDLLRKSNGGRVSRIFQRTDFLVSRIFQRFELCDGAHLLELLCGSRKLIEPIRTIGLC